MSFQIAARVLLGALTGVAITGVAVLGVTQNPSHDSEEARFTQLINDYRTANGLPPLLIDTSLEAAAEWKSNDMAVNRYFAHTDSLGRSPFQMMTAFGYGFNTFRGENLAVGYPSAEAVFTGWQASPGHNSNMLGVNYRVMGIGHVYLAGTPFGHYWSNEFGGLVIFDTPSVTPALPPPVTATPVPQACLDLNGDGRVNTFDVLLFIPFLTGVKPYDARFDLNLDGRVNTLDIVRFIPVLNSRC